MRLNTTTENTIRTLLFLAMCRESASGSKISQTLDIPQSDAVAILGSLKKVGMVSAQPGEEEGYALKSAPEEVTLWDILALREIPKLQRNLTRDASCEDCPDSAELVEEVYANLEECLEEVFRDVTLRDLMDKL